MFHLTIQLQGRGFGKDVLLITEGRFSGVAHGIRIGHISPEAARGGNIGMIEDGDIIVINPVDQSVTVGLVGEVLHARTTERGNSVADDGIQSGTVLDKYRRAVSSAHYGRV